MIPEAITALRLITVSCDGSTSLVSLTHRNVLVDGRFTTDSDVPHLDMTSDLENQIVTELGQQYDGSWPGWDAIYAYIECHPEVLNVRD